MALTCNTCFHHCRLKSGETGACRGRKNTWNGIEAINYGQLTSISLDPIEKKPLARFHPGAEILSVGSFGCNMHCPFCQNYKIAQEVYTPTTFVSPDDLCAMALDCRNYGNIGVAYTYNEPMISWEYIRDTGRLVHEADMVNVVVSNGTAEPEVIEQILPYVDAMNIDLKAFREETYSGLLGGSLEQTMEFIRLAAEYGTHLELTTLIVPGMNDTEEEIEDAARWIADLPNGEDITWHITRFFPRFHMLDRGPTDVSVVYHLADVAREYVKYVYTGNC